MLKRSIIPPGAVPACVLALLLSGCGSMQELLPDQSLQYKEQRESSENLELPPDLAGASFDDALDIPGASGTATYSSYAGERAARAGIAASGAVLPEVQGVSLRRGGDRRWLQVDAPPQAVWPEVVAFWRQQGIVLEEQDPATGIMKTGWLENRAEVRTDFITRQVRKVLDGMYSTSTRDQYRVRLDAGSAPDTTEVYLTHTGMAERLVRNTVGEGATTVWEPAPSDPDKEAVMLRRLMLHLGVSDRDAERMLTAGGGSAGAGAAAPTARAAGIGATLVGSGPSAELVIPGEYRQAWRQTDLALDRTGFAVEDRDRSAGVFFIRYDDAERGRGKQGLTDRLAFWRGSERGVEQYQVRLQDGGSETRVRVLDAAGQPTAGGTGERILALLQEELR
ncbi:outer membrane protein assembly factor BamC [Thiohalocapsa sp. ML1]|jgi:outer membrane protein assembly factor BamC|uniref:outer membrane protein assembly factor BamC n=1 Tax=Thiohalocapsa sp. ML1 TaxID=1431688 RepID=UPI0007323D7D|nr:outer membrane protein assembly factor BamC [Thiohalocapsa sp. ML1]